MTVPASGELSLGKIRQELETCDYTSGPYTTNATSLSDSETGLYATINTASPSYPNGIAPFAMSEWYSYDHGASAGSPISVEYLVIAGGGGGGGGSGFGSSGGGGGAGGYRSSISGENSGGGCSAESALSLLTLTCYTVTVGAGGSGGSCNFASTNGSNSVFSTVTSTGGGRGLTPSYNNPSTGGSGGGGRCTRGSGTVSQGFCGGLNTANCANTAGGGGGASTQGCDPNEDGFGCPGYRVTCGGTGVQSSVTGTATYRAGGGGGGSYIGWVAVTEGGLGGGGRGAEYNCCQPTAGTVNTGGGGGGGMKRNNQNRPGCGGGSGIVILRYSSSCTITVGGGLTSSTSTIGSCKVTEITAGTGQICFS